MTRTRGGHAPPRFRRGPASRRAAAFPTATPMEHYHMNDSASNRILGRVLAVEELNTVSGAWTLASDGDTSKSTDTGAYQVDTTNALIDIIISPADKH